MQEQSATSKNQLLVKLEIALDEKNAAYFSRVKGHVCKLDIEPESGADRKAQMAGIGSFATKDAEGGCLVIKLVFDLTPELGAYVIGILKKQCLFKFLEDEGQMAFPGEEQAELDLDGDDATTEDGEADFKEWRDEDAAPIDQESGETLEVEME